MRTGFDRQLKLLNDEMIKTGALCETAIALAAKTFETLDKENIASVKEMAEQIEQKERDIEAMCMKLLLQQQPVARDLRTISSALKMITDMERIGHQSADIVDIIRKSSLMARGDTTFIRNMAISTISMVTNSIDAFVQKDVDIARGVIRADDTVDDFFKQVKKSLIDHIITNPNDAEYILNVLLIAKYFERIGDHAVNIANWVIFSITGTHEMI